MRSSSQHQFSMIPRTNIPRSQFDRSHGYKTTFDSGYLVPFFVDEALPGDTFKLNASIFARMATPIAPIMDNLHLETFFFAVPLRLLWDNWQRFNGEQDNPNDSTDFLCPQINSGAGFDTGSISDYFGLPVGVPNLSVSSFWHRGYNLIYNEWFRDENLQESLSVPRGDGPDSVADFPLQRRGKRHDYFTSCLPWPQKGPGVELPLGGRADVVIPNSAISSSGLSLDINSLESRSGGYFWTFSADGSGAVSEPSDPFAPISYDSDGNSAYKLTTGTGNNSNGDPIHLSPWNPSSGLSWPVHASNSSGLVGGYADLSTATASTINSLRQAFQLQRLLERDARGGTRYTEILRSHFGVVSPDARLQRPEYLGGSHTRIHINPVAQTSATDSTSPQGNLSAFGVTSDTFHGFNKSFVEHSIIIGLVQVRADLTYQQGIPRMFSRESRFDFYWPALAHLGEQAVLNKEIYAQGTTADDDVFGYQERWAEYRYFPSQITGKFRSTDPQSLDYWHLSQEFSSLPTLSASFIQDNPPVARVIAVPSEPQFLLDCFFDLKCARPMPVYSVPGLIDHF